MNYKPFLKKHTLTLAIAFIALQIAELDAQAGYFRFWRGEKLESIDHTVFKNRLNENLLPATGALFQQNSGLVAYQPYMFTSAHDIHYGLPSEVALLEYTDEATYAAYRATDAGKAYGDLHWNLFEKTKSGSLVPEAYLGMIQTNHAYAITAPNQSLWENGITDVRVYFRDSRFNEADYLKSIQTHIAFTSGFSPLAYFVLVDTNYVLEYVLWSNLESRTAAERTTDEVYNPATQQMETVYYDTLSEITAYPLVRKSIFPGRVIQEGSGILYK